MKNLIRNIRYDWPLHFILLFTNWLPDNVIFMKMRGSLIRPFFLKCGKNFKVGRGNVFYNSQNIEFGDDVYIAFGNWFNASAKIVVNDQVLFGPKSIIVSSNHTKMNGSFRFGDSTTAPINIGFGAWIGGNCAILAGTTIGQGTLIAANTVVKGNVPNDCLYAGNPGTIKKRIDNPV